MAGVRIAIGAALACSLLSGAAEAGPPLDRPDLMDVLHLAPAAPEDLPDNATTSGAAIVAGEYEAGVAAAAAYGALAGTTAAEGNAFRLEWTVFEPDKLSRSSKQVKLGQKDHVAIALEVSGGDPGDDFSLAEAPAAGCKADVKVSGDVSGPASAQWKLGCKKGVLDDLGLTPAQQEVVLRFVNDKLSLKNSSQSLTPIP
jgi:hypothetical protein